MNQPFISIVIPVYNIEKYLRNCLDSVACQTYSNWECLLIDDGSTDSSGKICDDFARINKKFKVFHKINEGVSVARNVGIDNVKGDFVAFIDSDDIVTPDYLQAYVDCNPQPGSLSMIGIKTKTPIREFLSYTYDDIHSIEIDKAGPLIIKYDLFRDGGPTNKLFDRRLLINENLRFKTSLSFHEDHLFVYQYYLICTSINLSSHIGYYYMFYGADSCNSLSRLGKKNVYKLIEASKEFGEILPIIMRRFHIEDQHYINLVNTRNGYSQILLAILNMYKDSNFSDGMRLCLLKKLRPYIRHFRFKYSPVSLKRFLILTVLSLPIIISHKLLSQVAKWT